MFLETGKHTVGMQGWTGISRTSLPGLQGKDTGTHPVQVCLLYLLDHIPLSFLCTPQRNGPFLPFSIETVTVW